MKTLTFPTLLALCGLALRLSSPAQTLSVTSLVPSGNQLTITVRNTGTATGFQLQGSDSMAATSWGPLTAAFSPVAGQTGFFRATFNRPAGGRFFYRVIGLAGTAGDADGDGLADTLETIAGTGTNPSLFDTDGDGFSDGIEYASGTDPLNPLSRPNFGLPPTMQFAEANMAALEGTTLTVPLIFDRPYTGNVAYQVLATRSSAKAPADYAALSGTVAVSNGLGGIHITPVDDLAIADQKMLFIVLSVPTTTAYATGGRSFLGVRLVDNDAYWEGVLGPPPDTAANTSYLTRNFRLKSVQNAGGQQISFVAGAGNDGLPVLANETTPSSQSAGVIPPGTWPAVIASNNATLFSITSPAILMPGSTSAVNAGGSMFGRVTDLRRTLQLVANPAVNPVSNIVPNRIIGTWTEQTTSAGSPFLNRSATGSFYMIRTVQPLASLPVVP